MHPHHPLESHFRLLGPVRGALRKLGIATVEDLLYHFPARYGDTAEARNIAGLRQGDEAVVYGRISRLRTSKGFRTKMAMADGVVEDESGSIKCVWFNQPYLAKMIPEGALVRVEGKVSQKRSRSGAAGGPAGELYLSNPKVETVDKLPTAVGDSLFGADGPAHTLYPVYPESRGVSSNWIYHAIQKAFKSGILDAIQDPLPADILERYRLPSLATALVWIHAPRDAGDAAAARKRFAFEEIFFIQLDRQKEKREWKKNPAFVIEPKPGHIETFVERFGFPFTEAQSRAVAEILSDFKKGHAMSRLLEGDVGSGKTAVAATTAYAAVMAKLQVAYMAPTEILAAQHFESFIQYFRHAGIQVGLITGSGCRKFPSKIPRPDGSAGWTDISRAQLLKWVANGEIPILIGTHALIQKSVRFKNLAYAIVDEQHRFGTAQRRKLVRKDGIHPHLLSMTATPIPRTLALTMFGDLDLTLLDEMPAGRKTVITEVVTEGTREEMYEKVRRELRAGRQAYVICPRIDEPDPTKEMAVMAKSVTEEAKRLQERVFPEYRVAVLHGKMKDAEKERVMKDFKDGKVQVLVATSVVEVGVNVPNATVILIEGAERFGLSQLHQLRGRVIRSTHQAYCYLYAESRGDKTVERLRALTTAKNGFELAEFDLQFRGAGQLYGGRQWGVSDVAMEALQNIKMVEAARAEAQRLVDEDDSFARFPLLKAELDRRQKQRIHFE
ncbi:MAG TPA: ATP-dependent DNA helicase RecG [Candidatus Paceibacterota bacterium]|nr:ATP-dependent DNA helicase RecG [Candidatus Paceibacterota bacterium]